MFLPYRNQNPPESFPYGTIGLMIANVVTYCLTTQYGLVIKRSVVLHGGMSIAHFHLYQFLTSKFLETVFHDFAQAKQWYSYIKQRFPMSPITSQIDARINLLSKAAPKS